MNKKRKLNEPEMICPLCESSGQGRHKLEKHVLKTLTGKGEQERFRCPNCRIEFCKHVLTATHKDVNSFACVECTSPINECDCLDCEIFCEECNEIIFITCSDLDSIMYNNDDKKEKERFIHGP